MTFAYSAQDNSTRCISTDMSAAALLLSYNQKPNSACCTSYYMYQLQRDIQLKHPAAALTAS
jgi:hypothetical protein